MINYIINRIKKFHKLRLSERRRKEILAASRYATGYFQGEGFHVFDKTIKDFERAYKTTFSSRTEAEQWIIDHYLQYGD